MKFLILKLKQEKKGRKNNLFFFQNNFFFFSEQQCQENFLCLHQIKQKDDQQQHKIFRFRFKHYLQNQKSISKYYLIDN